LKNYSRTLSLHPSGIQALRCAGLPHNAAFRKAENLAAVA